MTIIPYFTIPGRTEEALDFYKDCFEGEVVFLQRFNETKYPVTEGFKNKIAHAEFVAEEIRFYISDGFEDFQNTLGDNVGMTINFSSREKQKLIYEALVEGGRITADFITTSINSTLVSIIDRFGIHWYLNYDNGQDDNADGV